MRIKKTIKISYVGIFLIFLTSLISIKCKKTSDSGIIKGPNEIQFPVHASVFVQGKFTRCEGIAFNGLEDLYVSGNNALWRVNPQAEVSWVADGFSNLGLAPIGDRDILYADFGQTNAWSSGSNSDGLVTDELGRIYIAVWGTGEIWRFDPQTNELQLIARNMPGVASMAFGRGKFAHDAIYATSTLLGYVWKVVVGVKGAPLNH